MDMMTHEKIGRTLSAGIRSASSMIGTLAKNIQDEGCHEGR